MRFARFTVAGPKAPDASTHLHKAVVRHDKAGQAGWFGGGPPTLREGLRGVRTVSKRAAICAA
jgi:hypothetical protein